MEAALTLFPFVLLAIIMVLANLDVFNPAFRWITYASLASLNSLLILMGLASLLLGAADLTAAGTGSAELLAASATFMRALGIVGVLGFLPLLRPVRAFLARFMPIDPDSTVHATALVYAIYALGVGIGQQPLVSEVELAEGLDVSLSSSLLWAQALGMVLLALPGVGAFIRRDWRETLDRFGFAPLTLRHLVIAVGSVLGLLAFQFVFSLAWEAIDPEGVARIEGIDNVLFGQLLTPAGAFAVGLTAAIGEELVFRGALQPRFGLVLTALLFTSVHSQYLFSPVTLLILVIGLVLGILRNRTSLSVCILVHFGFNFAGIMMAAAALPGT